MSTAILARSDVDARTRPSTVRRRHLAERLTDSSLPRALRSVPTPVEPAAPTPAVAPATTGPLAELVGADLQVPVLGGRHVRQVNLDVAASAPALRYVADAVTAALPAYSSVHRGAGLPSRACTARLEAARRTVGRFVGAGENDVVVFTRNTTDALNLLAGCLPEGTEAVCLDLEHHANLLPWTERGGRVVTLAETWAATLAKLDVELGLRPAGLISITGASNVTGEVPPIDQVVALARRHGARVALDAAQLAPHRAIDMTALGVDYVAVSGHKLYAPFGAGALIGRRDWLDSGRPHLAGGGAVRDVREGTTSWAAAPQRHEGGTPNLLGAVALAAACEALEVIGAERIADHERALLSRLLDGLAELEITVHRAFDDLTDHVGVVTFSVAGVSPGRVSAFLSAEHGIGVRDGRFCAHRLLGRLGRPDGAVRVSLGLGSSADDVDRLLGALRQLLHSGPHADYRRVDGAWEPVADDRDLREWLGEDEAVSAAAAAAAPCRAAV